MFCVSPYFYSKFGLHLASLLSYITLPWRAVWKEESHSFKYIDTAKILMCFKCSCFLRMVHSNPPNFAQSIFFGAQWIGMEVFLCLLFDNSLNLYQRFTYFKFSSYLADLYQTPNITHKFCNLCGLLVSWAVFIALVHHVCLG